MVPPGLPTRPSFGARATGCLFLTRDPGRPAGATGFNPPEHAVPRQFAFLGLSIAPYYRAKTIKNGLDHVFTFEPVPRTVKPRKTAAAPARGRVGGSPVSRRLGDSDVTSLADLEDRAQLELPRRLGSIYFPEFLFGVANGACSKAASLATSLRPRRALSA
jgi:hypothetical protein